MNLIVLRSSDYFHLGFQVWTCFGSLICKRISIQPRMRIIPNRAPSASRFSGSSISAETMGLNDWGSSTGERASKVAGSYNPVLQWSGTD